MSPITGVASSSRGLTTCLLPDSTTPPEDADSDADADSDEDADSTAELLATAVITRSLLARIEGPA
ncbi:MAG: hypothetical protein L0K67_06585 [Brevibacterium sp.]|nr:hypothetical protein [Brevibacterium sp.]